MQLHFHSDFSMENISAVFSFTNKFVDLNRSTKAAKNLLFDVYPLLAVQIKLRLDSPPAVNHTWLDVVAFWVTRVGPKLREVRLASFPPQPGRVARGGTCLISTLTWTSCAPHGPSYSYFEVEDVPSLRSGFERERCLPKPPPQPYSP